MANTNLNPDPNPNVLWHQSGINRKGEPFIQLLNGGKMVCQLTPQDARDHARAIMEAAEAAEQDSFLFLFSRTTLGLDEGQAAAFLTDFRKHREKTGKKGPASDPQEFVITDEHKKSNDLL